MSKRKRSVQLNIHGIDVREGWSDAALTVSDYGDDDAVRSAVLCIKNPWQLRSLRHALDKIEKHWRTMLESP